MCLCSRLNPYSLVVCVFVLGWRADEEDREGRGTSGLPGPREENLPSLYRQPCHRVSLSSDYCKSKVKKVPFVLWFADMDAGWVETLLFCCCFVSKIIYCFFDIIKKLLQTK